MHYTVWKKIPKQTKNQPTNVTRADQLNTYCLLLLVTLTARRLETSLVGIPETNDRECVQYFTMS